LDDDENNPHQAISQGAALPGHRAIPTPLKKSFDTIDTQLTACIDQLALAA
jgi:hypothetical protein